MMAVSTPERAPAQTDAGVIEEARRHRRSRRARSSRAGFVLLAGVGTLLALLLSAGSLSRAHKHPQPSPGAVNHHEGSLRVALSPNLEPGRPGWCVAATVREAALGFGCTSLLTRAHPFLGEGWAWARGAGHATRLILTPRQVTSIRVGRETVPTRAVAGAPFDLRVAVLERPIGRRRAFFPAQTITVDGSASREGAETREAMPVRYWKQPEAAPRGVCELRTSLNDLGSSWGGVVSAMRGTSGQLVGAGFVPCLDAGYALDGHALQAAVLLDAAQPARRLPAAIPGLIEIPREPGLYNTAPDLGFAEPLTAKRQGNAWIVVAGGGRNAERARIALLSSLSAALLL